MTQPSAYLSDQLLNAPGRQNAWTAAKALHKSQRQPHPSPLTFAVVTTRSQFNALEADWCDLFERAAIGHHVFQTFHWLWHWANHFLDTSSSRTELAIVTGRKSGKLVLVWPIVKQRVGGLTQITWMGHPVSQYGDVLCDHAYCTDADLLASWRFLQQNISADVALLKKVRGDAHVASLLNHLCAAPLTCETAPYLDLSSTNSFEDYQKRYSSKARKNRRRLRRRIEERTLLKVSTHNTGEPRARLAAKAVELKRKWLQARGLISHAIQDDRTRDFFESAANCKTHPTGCRATELKIDDDTAAIEISFVAKGHCAVHIIVYDMKHEKAGAGVLLMEDGIRSAIAANIKTFDLMAPGDNYKSDWADGVIDVHDWSVPLSPIGHAFASLKLNKLPSVLKSSLHALPLMARRALHEGFARLR